MQPLNNVQNSSLENLRKNIEDRKKGITEINTDDYLKEKLKVAYLLLEIPEITIESGEVKSDERHEQLIKKVEVLFHNYTVSEEKFIQSNDDMRNAYKELAKCFKELLQEGLKTRF